MDMTDTHADLRKHLFWLLTPQRRTKADIAVHVVLRHVASTEPWRSDLHKRLSRALLGPAFARHLHGSGSIQHGPVGSGVCNREKTRHLQSMSTHTLDRIDLASPYWSHAHLAAALPVGRTRRYEIIKEPDFPLPIRLTPGADPVWVASEVREWIESRPRVKRPVRPVINANPHKDQGTLEFVPVAAGRRRRSA